jgi:hypothetical protein
MEEQLRQKAIQRFLSGENPKSIYTSLKRTKPWFFKWLRRYQSGTKDWFKDQCRAPLICPKRIADIERQRIIKVRKDLESQPFAQFGASAIKWELSKSGFGFPSDRTINRVLKQEGLVKKNCLCPQRGRVSVFYRAAGLQQHSSGRSGRPTVHKR